MISEAPHTDESGGAQILTPTGFIILLAAVAVIGIGLIIYGLAT